MGKMIGFLARFGKAIGDYSIRIGVSNLKSVGLIVLILLLSFWTRFYNLSHPDHLVFDENFFVPIAQDYLDGKFHGDPHPPLGRLLITAGAYLYKDKDESKETPVGEEIIVKGSFVQYRIAPAFFGALIPLLIFFITKLFTDSNTFSFLAAFLVIFDNALTVHTRFALFDEIQIFFILASLFFSLYFIKCIRRGKGQAFKRGNIIKRFFILTLAGVFAGAAIATKFTGLTAVGVLYLAVLYKTYRDKFDLTFKSNVLIFLETIIPAIAITCTFFFAWWVHFTIIEYPGKYLEEYSPEFQACFQGEESDCKLSLYELTSRSIDWSFNYESLVPPIDFCKEGEMGSLPYQWPLMARTIAYSFTNHAGIPLTEVSYVYLTGNPVVWYSALFAIFVGFSLLFSSLFILNSLFDKKILVLLFIYLVHYVPYFFIERVMYFYHYFTAFLISIVLFSYLLHKFYNLHKKRKIFKLFGKFFFIQYLLIVLIGFLLYAPLTYNKKIDISYMEKLIITDLWNLKADPYNYNNP